MEWILRIKEINFVFRLYAGLNEITFFNGLTNICYIKKLIKFCLKHLKAVMNIFCLDLSCDQRKIVFSQVEHYALRTLQGATKKELNLCFFKPKKQTLFIMIMVIFISLYFGYWIPNLSSYQNIALKMILTRQVHDWQTYKPIKLVEYLR